MTSDKWQAARGKWQIALNRSANAADLGLCNYLPDWEGTVRCASEVVLPPGADMPDGEDE